MPATFPQWKKAVKKFKPNVSWTDVGGGLAIVGLSAVGAYGAVRGIEQGLNQQERAFQSTGTRLEETLDTGLNTLAEDINNARGLVYEIGGGLRAGVGLLAQAGQEMYDIAAEQLTPSYPTGLDENIPGTELFPAPDADGDVFHDAIQPGYFDPSGDFHNY